MTVVSRTFASVPARSAQETWDAIVDLIAPDSHSPAKRELAEVAGVACSIIAGEMRTPMVVYCAGPRIRIYCVYGDDAMEGNELEEKPLSFVPTDGDWRMSLPCPAEELPWVRRNLAASGRVSARDEAEGPAVDEVDGECTDAGTNPGVDRDAFLRE